MNISFIALEHWRKSSKRTDGMVDIILCQKVILAILSKFDPYVQVSNIVHKSFLLMPSKQSLKCHQTRKCKNPVITDWFASFLKKVCDGPTPPVGCWFYPSTRPVQMGCDPTNHGYFAGSQNNYFPRGEETEALAAFSARSFNTRDSGLFIVTTCV